MEQKTYVVAGWNGFNYTFQEAIVSQRKCVSGKLVNIAEMQFCTNHADVNCTPMLGAPLGKFVWFLGKRFVQFGINLNQDPKQGCQDKDMVFLKVAYCMDWIVANMEE